MKRTLAQFFELMQARFGPTGWWPGDSPFEIAVGAVLVQNTAWRNVEKAIQNLKRSGMLSPNRILEVPVSELEDALRPSGFFRVKAERLRRFCGYLVERHGGDMTRMAQVPAAQLRVELLGVHGIGPETADDILLYACHRPVFVVDAYTRRILSRHGLVAPDLPYESLRAYFEKRLRADVDHFQEFHALLVLTGNGYCRRQPKCEECPLVSTLKRGQPLLP